jgi:hypothetical protein
MITRKMPFLTIIIIILIFDSQTSAARTRNTSHFAAISPGSDEFNFIKFRFSHRVRLYFLLFPYFSLIIRLDKFSLMNT